MLAEKWVNNVISVTRYDHQCLQLHFLVGTITVNVISCYAPPSSLSAEKKDTFYNKIVSLITVAPDEKMLLIGWHFNGHLGKHTAGFEGVHMGNGYGVIKPDGLGILHFGVANKLVVAANKLVVANIFFQKYIGRVITHSSGGNQTQFDYILVKRSNLKNIKDTKAISSEESIIQHKLLVYDLIVSAKSVKPTSIPPWRKTLKLKDAGIQEEFEQRVTTECQTIPARVENGWKSNKNGVLEAADEIWGWTWDGFQWHKETWSWNETVDNAVKVEGLETVEKWRL